VRNKLLAASGRFMPREWLARVGARLRDLLTDIERWPSWFRACKWVRLETTDSAARPASFRWKAHPIALRSTVVATNRPHSFAFLADARGLHAEHAFQIRPTADGTGTVVVSHETQVGPLPRFGRAYLAPRLRKSNQAWLDDLARVASGGAATRARLEAGSPSS